MSAQVLPPVCILAGGLGSRLGEVGESTPKALVEVAGAPFIDHQLALLADNGAREVVICVGHLGDQIESELGSSRCSLALHFAHDPPGLAGTAGAIRGAIELLGEEFLVLYGDTYLRIDYRDFTRAFRSRGMPAQMAVLRNKGRWGSSNVEFDGELVVRHDKAANGSMEWIDYGLGAFHSSVFRDGAGKTASDLSEVYAELAANGRLGGYEAEHRFYEIGTPESLAETDRFLRDR